MGEKVDAKVTAFDSKSRKLTLSIKAREIDEDKQAMAQYGSSDSGASLGDILGAALNRANQERAEKADADADAEDEDDKPARKAKAKGKAKDEGAEAAED